MKSVISKLAFTPFEKLPIGKPVDRISYVAEQCRGRSVLDLGCYDETALLKKNSGDWLHEQIATVAKSVVGLDNSSGIPAEGIATGPTSRIMPGDVTNADHLISASRDAEVIVACELIEHLPDTLSFFRDLKEICSGRRLIVSTPNATSITNGLLATARRESTHVDHLQIYSYKTLSTLCIRAGFKDWTILPYHVRYSEIALRTAGWKHAVVRGVERAVNFAEWIWPMSAGGIILHVNDI
jgi:SAM-dependent methyltransferase